MSLIILKTKTYKLKNNWNGDATGEPIISYYVPVVLYETVWRHIIVIKFGTFMWYIIYKSVLLVGPNFLIARSISSKAKLSICAELVWN